MVTLYYQKNVVAFYFFIFLEGGFREGIKVLGLFADSVNKQC